MREASIIEWTRSGISAPLRTDTWATWRTALKICFAALLGLAFVGGVTALAAEYIDLDKGGRSAKCHCPCSLDCDADGTPECDCTMHPAECQKCKCVGILTVGPQLEALLAAPFPKVRIRYASFLVADPPTRLRVGVRAASRDGTDLGLMRIRLVSSPDDPYTYVPDDQFDAVAYRTWADRVDPEQPARISAGFLEDPATYRIVDRDAAHLNDPIEMSFLVVGPDGSEVLVGTDHTTLGAEMLRYLRSAVAGVDGSAFVGQPVEVVRSEVAGLLDSLDVFIKAYHFDAAVATVDRVIEKLRAASADPDRRDVRGAICAFSKFRHLLTADEASPAACPQL